MDTAPGGVGFDVCVGIKCINHEIEDYGIKYSKDFN